MRTLKEELIWIHEWHSPFMFIQALERWLDNYNNEYLHSALNYQTPVQFEQQNRGNFLLAYVSFLSRDFIFVYFSNAIPTIPNPAVDVNVKLPSSIIKCSIYSPPK